MSADNVLRLVLLGALLWIALVALAMGERTYGGEPS